MKSTFKMLGLVAAMLLPLLSQAQSYSYTCSFENPSDTDGWTFVNSNTVNKWYIDSAVASDGSRSMYISTDNGATHGYNNGSSSVSYACRTFALSAGDYNLSYVWHCNGESNYDYLRVYMAPAGTPLTPDVIYPGAGISTTPSGWISLDGGTRLNMSANWQSMSQDFMCSDNDTVMLIFMWRSDGSAGSNPPAAVDSIVITQYPCSRVPWCRVEEMTTTSFDLLWSGAFGNAQYYVEIDTAGFPRGTTAAVPVSDTMYSFVGLEPNSVYTVYLAADCSGDTSPWISITVRTACVPETQLPFFENFEGQPTGGVSNTQFVECWGHVNNYNTVFGYPYVSTTSHGTGSRGLYWYSGGSYGPYSGVVLPDIDSTSYPVDTLRLTFWARPTLTSYRPRFVVGVLPNVLDITTFIPVDTITLQGSTEWQEVVVPFDTYRGHHGRIAVLAPATTPTWYAYVDDFRIDVIPECGSVSGITAERVGTGSAYLSWHLQGGSAHTVMAYEVQWDTLGATAYRFTDTVQADRYMLTNLDCSTDYSVRIRALCLNDLTTGDWDSVALSTVSLPCMVVDTTSNVLDTVVITSGVSSASNVFVNYSWGNTFCESIYPAEELSAAGLSAGRISAITVGYTSAGSYAKEISIFMGHTDMNEFTSASAMVNVTTLTEVCHAVQRPNTSASVGWVTYQLDTPFDWDGVSNIILGFFVNQSGNSQSSSGFYSYATPTTLSRRGSAYRYKDSNPFTASTQGTYSGSGTSMYVPSVSFLMNQCLQYSPCGKPLMLLTKNTLDTVTIEWGAANHETAWNIWYKADDDTVWTTIDSTTETVHHFTDLLPQTHYTVRVAPLCGGDSIYSSVAFYTPCLPVLALPFTEDFENFTAPSSVGAPITLCWNRLSTSSNPYVTSSYSNSGTRSLYFYGYSSNPSLLVLPEFGIPVDTLQLSFAALKTSANYSIIVGAMTDPDDFSTFVPIDTVSPTSNNNWEMFEVNFDQYTGTGRYIALACAMSSASVMYIDDITVDYIPSCVRPHNVAAGNVGTHSADIAWDGTGAEYIVEYGPYGFGRGSGTFMYITADSTTLYGLRPASRYQVYVRSVCAMSDSSQWSFPMDFITQCAAIDTLPYVEDFMSWGTGTSVRPACWTGGGYSNYPYISNFTTSENSYRGLYMYTSGASNDVYASILELDSLQYPIHTVRTIFRAVATNTSYDYYMAVGVCNQPGDLTTFVPVDTVQVYTTPTDYEATFDTVTSGGKYITFVSFVNSAQGAYYNPVYLLNVRVEALPSCQSPNQMAAANVTSSAADISWHGRGTSTEWEMEYGVRGFAHGTGTRQTVVSTPTTLTGLQPATEYDVYLRSVCGAGDTSEWTFMPLRFSTRQNPASVPYHYDYEASAEWANWQTCSNVDVNWFRDTAAGSGNPTQPGSFSMYVSADSGATCFTRFVVVNASAYRDFDFGNDPNNSYTLTFRAKTGGNVNGNENGIREGLMVFLVDPDVPVRPSSANITTPWGPVNNMSRLATIHANGYWNTYTVTLDTLTGVHRLAFYWFNQYENTSWVGPSAAVDEVTIARHDCARPAGFRVEDISMSSAEISWIGPDTGMYRVSVRAQAGPAYSLDDTVYTNRIRIRGLSSGSRYSLQARLICSEEQMSAQSAQYVFSTLICNGGVADTIATTQVAQSDKLPYSTTHRFSYTQQIYTASEINGSGEISAISFNIHEGHSLAGRGNCTIYMGHTTMSSFTEDFIDPSTLTMVYVGNLNGSAGWNQYILQTPFVYNGTSNLVVAIDDNSNYSTTYTGYYSRKFDVDQFGSPMAVCYYSDNYNPVADTAGLASFQGSFERYNTRPQVIFEVCPPNQCPQPLLRNPIIRSNSVTLRWRNTSDRYTLSYRLNSTSSWLTDNLPLTDTFYTINRTYPNTDYVYRVRQYCDSTGISNWIYGYFNSSDIPCLAPENLHTETVTNNKATLRWTPAENNLSYELHVWNTYFDTIITCYISRTTVKRLDAGVTYFAAVRAVCDGFDAPGEYSDTIAFSTPVCPDASNLQVMEVYGNSAVLDWTPNGQEIGWQIAYGPIGFTIDHAVIVTADVHPFTLEHLIGSSDYEAYVRTVCAADFNGEHWIGPVRFTTLYSAINSATDDARVGLNPNPASDKVTITLPESGSALMVEVMDVTGRLCSTLQLSAGTTQYTLSTADLASGTYFLRITADDINTIKKLIVR